MEYEDLKQIIKVVKSESEFVKFDSESDWTLIPENVLVKILKYLNVKDILACSEVCQRWNFISNDSLLWKFKFQQDFKIEKNIPRKPGKILHKRQLIRSPDGASHKG